MAKAKRRRTAASPASEPRESEIDAQLKEMAQEAQGAWSIKLYHADSVPEILIASWAGNAEAQRVLGLFDDTAQRIGAQPVLCLTCDYGFSLQPGCMPAVLVLFEAYNTSSGLGLTQAVCSRCFARHQDHAALENAVVAALAYHIGLTNFRRIDVGPPGQA